MIDELPNSVRIRERDDYLDDARSAVYGVWQVHCVVKAVGRLRYAIDLRNQEICLVDVEGMDLARRILHGPLFDVPDPHLRVYTVRVELLAVDEERLAIRRFGEG